MFGEIKVRCCGVNYTKNAYVAPSLEKTLNLSVTKIVFLSHLKRNEKEPRQFFLKIPIKFAFPLKKIKYMNQIISFLLFLLLGTTLFAQKWVPTSAITLGEGHFSEKEVLQQIKINLKLHKDTHIQLTTDSIKVSNARVERQIIRIQQQIWAIRQQKRDIHKILAQQDKSLQKKELKKYLRKIKVIPFDENNIQFSCDSAFSYLDNKLAEKSKIWNKANEDFLFEKTILIPHFEGDTALFWAKNVLSVYHKLKRECASLPKKLELTELKELRHSQIYGYAEMELQREINQIWVYFYEGGLQDVLKVVAKCAVIPNENLNYEGRQTEILQDSFQNYREHKLQNLDMIAVKGGTFLMGNEKGNADEKPVFQTELSDFYIGKTEVTVAQYRLFCEAKNKQLPNPPSYGWKENAPITDINWNEAVAFCEWLSQISGRNYTLPTETQWEFAAGGGLLSANYLYSGSDSIEEVAYYEDNSDGKSHFVAGKKPNELGIYDMTGNVYEWCLDDYDADFYASVKNPNKDILNTKNTGFKVFRGGSWIDNAKNSRITFRYFNKPTYYGLNLGFRVCCSFFPQH